MTYRFTSSENEFPDISREKNAIVLMPVNFIGYFLLPVIWSWINAWMILKEIGNPDFSVKHLNVAGL